MEKSTTVDVNRFHVSSWNFFCSSLNKSLFTTHTHIHMLVFHFLWIGDTLDKCNGFNDKRFACWFVLMEKTQRMHSIFDDFRNDSYEYNTQIWTLNFALCAMRFSKIFVCFEKTHQQYENTKTILLDNSSLHKSTQKGWLLWILPNSAKNQLIEQLKMEIVASEAGEKVTF